MESSVRSRSAKFKQLRHFTAVTVLTLGVAACAGVPRHPVPRPAAKQPLARMVVVTPDAQHDLLAQLLAGEMALSRSDLKSAAAFYGKAMMLSHEPEVAERAARLSIAVQDNAAARRALARWKALGATPTAMARVHAELALQDGDTAEARHQLQLLTDSGHKNAWREFGRVLLGARDQAQAVSLLEALATPQRLPDDPQAWLAMSELGEKYGRHTYATRIAEAAVQRFKTAETYAWAAQVAFRNGDHVEARALLRQAITKAPKDTRLRLAYAGMLSQQGRYTEASDLLAHGPQDAAVYRLRVALAAQQHDDKALAALYRQLEHASPKLRRQSAYLLGQLAEMQHHKNEALAWYRQVGNDDPHAFEADLRSAVILQSQGKSADAHQLLGQLQMDYLDQPKQLRQAYQVDAELYLRDQQYPQAEVAFSHALQLLPNDPGLLYGRGLAYAEAGQVDLAVKDFRHLLKIKPDDVDASNALGYTLADANRDLPEAERLLQHARAAKPHDPAIADSWGWLQYRLGHLSQAAETLRDAWLASKDADVGVHLGEVLWQQGHRQAAERIFGAVRKVDPHSRRLQAALQRLKP